MLIACIGLSFLADAQSSTSSRLKGDTLTNADTVVVSLPAAATDGLTGIQVTYARVSGTIGGGTAVLQGSIDGIAWVAAASDTLTLTNVAAQGIVWPITSNAYRLYRVRIISAGTQTGIPTVSWLKRGVR